MTPKEAIVIVENEKPCCGEKLIFTEEERYEALNMAISALEKQIPKKPITTKDGNKSCSCGLVVQTGHIRNCLYYCDNCGQAIDWRNVE